MISNNNFKIQFIRPANTIPMPPSEKLLKGHQRLLTRCLPINSTTLGLPADSSELSAWPFPLNFPA
ncbi:hypothetical protein [Methylomonas albis]|nr:hypothetical protein [Methylomonas albis]